MEHSRQYFSSLEELYRQRFGAFLALASKHIYNRDYAIDAVHDAFGKSLEYFERNPDKRVRESIVRWLILKACKRYNKWSVEVTSGDTRVHNDE